MEVPKRNILLSVPAYLYGIGVRIRNYAFDQKWLRSVKPSIPTICIGNLSVGGTGKTPHVEMMIRMLRPYYRLAVLTRGYGRKTRGPLIATPEDTAYTIGDEPFQIMRKYPDVMVYVDGNRRRAIADMEQMDGSIRPEVIIMDDGYQHRYVSPAYTILLTSYHRPYFKDSLLPYGNLREAPIEHLRADSIIVTHIPDSLSPMDFRVLIDDLDMLQHQDVYFSRVSYGSVTPIFPDVSRHPTRDTPLLVLSGIADPTFFFAKVESLFSTVEEERTYADHHAFKDEEIYALVDEMESSPDLGIMTTEKDAMRLLSFGDVIPDRVRQRMWYLPIEVELSPKNMDRLLSKTREAISRNGLNVLIRRK